MKIALPEIKTLLSRNVALILAAVLTAELITGLLVNRLVIVPQTNRIATIMARTITAVSETMAAVPANERKRLIARLSAGSALSIRPDIGAPPEGAGWPSYIEMRYMDALASQLRGQHGFEWRSDRSRRLWLKVNLAGDFYWLTAEVPNGFNPAEALVASLSVAFAAAGVGSILIQRRIDAPMRRLAEAAARVGTQGGPGWLPEDGPREIAEVSRSFNIMTQRIAEVDAERTLMLAGISHDLRTPLARLRLVLAMLPASDLDLSESAARQVDQIDQMLGQFLDFARGASAEARVTTDLATLAREAIEMADTPCDIAIEPGSPSHALLQPRACQRAVFNLIANAQRHGALPISVAIGGSADAAWIAVRDHGPGIDPELRHRLVRPFVRGNAARGGTGTGLGLTIVEHVTRANQGVLDFATLHDGRFEARMTFGHSGEA